MGSSWLRIEVHRAAVEVPAYRSLVALLQGRRERSGVLRKTQGARAGQALATRSRLENPSPPHKLPSIQGELAIAPDISMSIRVCVILASQEASRR